MSCIKVFPGYSVWTRSLNIDFKYEGRTDLELRFVMSPEQEVQIREELQTKGRSTPSFEYGYYLEDGTLCTHITARIAIRAKGYKAKTMD